jgi:hypothetical protein
MNYYFNHKDIIIKTIKYLLIGIMVTLACIYIPESSINIKEAFIIGLIGSIVFVLLDIYSPSVSIVIVKK